MKRFEGQVIVVTGGASGIGRATVNLLRGEGAHVVVADVQPTGGREPAVDVRLHGDIEIFARYVKAVSHLRLTALHPHDPARREHAGPHGLVNCAGVLGKSWGHTLAVNATGTLNMMQAFLPGMLVRGRGAIVNVASIGGVVGVPGLPAYAASKGAVIQLTRTYAAMHAAAGVRINAVCPGLIPTGFNDPQFDDRRAEQEFVEERVPMRRQGSPEEVAACIAFLLSEEASYVTGSCLTVDGGLTCAL